MFRHFFFQMYENKRSFSTISRSSEISLRAIIAQLYFDVQKLSSRGKLPAVDYISVAYARYLIETANIANTRRIPPQYTHFTHERKRWCININIQTFRNRVWSRATNRGLFKQPRRMAFVVCQELKSAQSGKRIMKAASVTRNESRRSMSFERNK